jgi:hypothetical protein
MHRISTMRRHDGVVSSEIVKVRLLLLPALLCRLLLSRARPKLGNKFSSASISRRATGS